MVVLPGLPGLPAFAGPQDDPPPPVAIVAGDGRVVPNFTYSLTLTLDGATGNGDLEQGQVEQARAAAAAAQAGTGAGKSSGERPSGSTSGAGSGNAGTPVVGECTFRPATVPAGYSRLGGNDPATGTLLVNPCNGPGRYVFVPNPAPGDPAAAAPPPPPPPPDPAVLAQQAYAELTLPEPLVRRSPPETNSDPDNGGLPYTFVGLQTWVWALNWQPLQRTVDLRGVSATVSATPTALV